MVVGELVADVVVLGDVVLLDVCVSVAVVVALLVALVVMLVLGDDVALAVACEL